MLGISSREAVNCVARVRDPRMIVQEPVCIGALSSDYNDHDKLLKPRTWSRKSMNFWASLPPRLLASAILDGEVKRDRTSERHSFDVISAESVVVQNRSSEVSSSGWCTCRGQRRGVIGSGGSQDMFVARYHSRGVVSKIYIPVDHRENCNAVNSRLGVKLLNRVGLRCFVQCSNLHRSHRCTIGNHT